MSSMQVSTSGAPNQVGGVSPNIVHASSCQDPSQIKQGFFFFFTKFWSWEKSEGDSSKLRTQVALLTKEKDDLKKQLAQKTDELAALKLTVQKNSQDQKVAVEAIVRKNWPADTICEQRWSVATDQIGRLASELVVAQRQCTTQAHELANLQQRHAELLRNLDDVHRQYKDAEGRLQSNAEYQESLIKVLLNYIKVNSLLSSSIRDLQTEKDQLSQSIQKMVQSTFGADSSIPTAPPASPMLPSYPHRESMYPALTSSIQQSGSDC